MVQLNENTSMRYPLSLLFFFAMVTAVEIALGKNRIPFETLAVVGLCMFLVWNKLAALSKAASQSSISFRTDAVLSGVSVAICIAAIFQMLFPAIAAHTPSPSKSFQTISNDQVLILATLLLARDLVFIRYRESSKVFQTVGFVLSWLLFVVFLSFVIGPFLWLTYIASKAIEHSMSDYNHILGPPGYLTFRDALLKATLGAFGFLAWFFLAMQLYRRVQNRPSGLFLNAWLAFGIGCFSTVALWCFLFSDFPQLREAFLQMLSHQNYGFNVLLFLFLCVTGIFHFCLMDRQHDENSVQSVGAWKNRLAGIMMMIPIILLLVESVLDFLRFGGWAGFNFGVWMFLVEHVTGSEPYMLLALFIFGIEVIRNAANQRVRFLPVPATALLQLFCLGCLVVFFLPAHLVALQFYLDAVITLLF